MEVTGYFDESGTHVGSDCITVAGFLASAENWERLEAEWIRTLLEFDLSLFRMSQFAHRQGQFQGWGEDRRIACVGKLIDIIVRHVECSIGVSLPGKDFREVVSPKAQKVCGGPYGLAAAALFLEVGDVMHGEYPHGWVNYVFESGAVGSEQVTRTFQENQNDPKDKEDLRLLSLTFASKNEFVPLQTADILAYELYQQLPRQLGLNQRPTRATLKLLAGLPRRWRYLDRAELAKWNGIIEIRASLSPDQLI